MSGKEVWLRVIELERDDRNVLILAPLLEFKGVRVEDGKIKSVDSRPFVVNSCDIRPWPTRFN